MTGARPTDRSTFWLDSFDAEPPLTRMEVAILATATCGSRDDWVWADVSPPITVGPTRSLGEPITRDTVALGSRHEGSSIADGPWPVHVYICRMKDPDRQLASEFKPDDVAIEYWGLLTPIEE